MLFSLGIKLDEEDSILICYDVQLYIKIILGLVCESSLCSSDEERARSSRTERWPRSTQSGRKPEQSGVEMTSCKPKNEGRRLSCLYFFFSDENFSTYMGKCQLSVKKVL